MKEQNKSELLQDALQFLDDEMIEEVDRLRGQVQIENGNIQEKIESVSQKSVKKGPNAWRKWTAIAASIGVVALVGGLLNQGIGRGISDSNKDNSHMEESIPDITPENEEINDNVELDDRYDILDGEDLWDEVQSIPEGDEEVEAENTETEEGEIEEANR